MCVYMDGLLELAENELYSASSREARELALVKWHVYRELIGKTGILRKYPETLIEEGAKHVRSDSN